MSWIKSIKCIPPILLKAMAAKCYTEKKKSYSQLMWQQAGATYSQSEACITHGSQDDDRSQEQDGSRDRNSGHVPYSKHIVFNLLFNNYKAGACYHPSSYFLFVLVDEVTTQHRIWKDTWAFTPCTIYIHSLDTCTQSILSKHWCALKQFHFYKI